MTRHGIAFRLVMVAASLAAVAAWAADTPEVAARKRQLEQAFQGFYADGVCGVFTDLGAWQGANWPEGKTVVHQLLMEKILPRFTADPATYKDKTPVEIENEYLKFCTQTGFQALQALTSLSKVPAAEVEQANQLRDRMLMARFLGQCQTASAFYLQGPKEHKNTLEKFIVAEIYAKDPKYRHAEVGDKEQIERDPMAEVDKLVANDEKAMQYWRDCDTAAARIKEVLEELKVVP